MNWLIFGSDGLENHTRMLSSNATNKTPSILEFNQTAIILDFSKNLDSSFETTLISSVDFDSCIIISVRDKLKLGYKRLGRVTLSVKEILKSKMEEKMKFALEPGKLNPGVKGFIYLSFLFRKETIEIQSDLPRIEKVVVLCMENRSFDHMLGYMDGVNGIKGKEKEFAVEGVEADDKAKHIQLIDLGHTMHHTRTQLQGKWISDAKKVAKLQLLSLKWNISNLYSAPEEIIEQEAETCMQCFSPDQLPVLSTLAKEFCVFDSWHSSLAGPTHPNRWFLHCGQSGGCLSNTQMCPSPMIFDSFDEDDWKIYFHDMSGTVLMSSVLIHKFYTKEKKNIRQFNEFYEDARSGNLPKYSFLEPTYYSSGNDVANDQHPPHDVREGEQLILDVYKAISSNQSQFEKTLLLIVYDEHGGFHDHVKPPITPGVTGEVHFLNDGDFRTLGFRVPCIAINPYIKSGTVDSRLFDHCSLPATLIKLFDLPDYLTERVHSATTFEDVLTLKTPRTVQEMPDHHKMQSQLDELKKLTYDHSNIPRETVEKLLKNPRGWVIGTEAFKAIKSLFRGAMQDDLPDDIETEDEDVQKGILQGIFSSFMAEKKIDKSVLLRLESMEEIKVDLEKSEFKK